MRSFRGSLCRRLATLAVVVFLPMATTACLGSSKRSWTASDVSREAGSPLPTRQVVFLLKSVFLVYGAGVLVEAPSASTADFWGGDDPFGLPPGTTRELAGSDGQLLRFGVRDGGVIDFELEEASGNIYPLRLVQEPGGLSAFDRHGRLLGSVRDAGGHPSFMSGSTIAALP